MPRLLGKLPAYRKHKASGQAVVTLGGHDHYLGKMGSAASRTKYNRVVEVRLFLGSRDRLFARKPPDIV